MTFQKACKTFIGKGTALAPTTESSINCDPVIRSVSFGSVLSLEDLENMTGVDKIATTGKKAKVVTDYNVFTEEPPSNSFPIPLSPRNMDYMSLKSQDNYHVENTFRACATPLTTRQASNPFIHISERNESDFFSDYPFIPNQSSEPLINIPTSDSYMLPKDDLCNVITNNLTSESSNEGESSFSSSVSESFVTQCGEPDNLIRNLNESPKKPLSMGEKLFANESEKHQTKALLPSSDEFLKQALYYEKNAFKNTNRKTTNPLISNTDESSSAVLDTSFTRLNTLDFMEEEKESFSIENSTSYASTSAVDCTQFLAQSPLFSLKATVSVLNEEMQQKMDKLENNKKSNSAQNNEPFSLSASMSLKSVYAELDLDPEVTNVNDIPFGYPSCGEESSNTNVSISISILLDINKSRINDEQLEYGKNLAGLIFSIFKEYKPQIYTFLDKKHYTKIDIVYGEDSSGFFQSLDNDKITCKDKRSCRLSIEDQITNDFELYEFFQNGIEDSSANESYKPSSLRNLFVISTTDNPLISLLPFIPETICHTVSLNGDPVCLPFVEDDEFSVIPRNSGWTFTSLSTSFYELKEALKSGVLFQPISQLKVSLHYPPASETSLLPPLVIAEHDRINPGCKMKYILRFLVPHDYNDSILILEDEEAEKLENTHINKIHNYQKLESTRDLDKKVYKTCALVKVAYKLPRVQGTVTIVFRVMRIVNTISVSSPSINSYSVELEENDTYDGSHLSYELNTSESESESESENLEMEVESVDMNNDVCEYCEKVDLIREEMEGPGLQRDAEFAIVIGGVERSPASFLLFDGV